MLKGISVDDDAVADNILLNSGIICNWWRKVRTISPVEVRARLTERNLLWHLSHYDEPDPTEGNEPFSEHTPFISTTAGAIERDPLTASNIFHDPFAIALDFATDAGTRSGYIFYGYVFTLGKKSVPLQYFSEEVRELNIYTDYLEYQLEGEITAKISIPSVLLQRYERYEVSTVQAAALAGVRPDPDYVRVNPNFADPTRFSNIRAALS